MEIEIGGGAEWRNIVCQRLFLCPLFPPSVVTVVANTDLEWHIRFTAARKGKHYRDLCHEERLSPLS